MTTLNKDDVKTTYEILRNFDSYKQNFEKIKDLVPEVEKKIGAANFETVFKLFSRVAKSTTESEFAKIIETNELPPIKLSKEEQELVKGGRTIFYYIGYVVGIAERINNAFQLGI
jgi:hypothetical protein